MKITKITKLKPPRVVVTTWQSALRQPKEWFLNYGMVIGDEAHGFKSKSLNTIMTNLVNANFRIGTTGTIDNIQCNKLVLIGNFGPVHRVTSTRELMDANTLATLKINCLVLKYPDELRKIVSRAEYKEEIDFIVSYEPRNRFIANLTADQTGNTLVLYNYVEKHGKPLHKLIADKIKDPSRKVFFVSGAVAADEREHIREITELHDNLVHLHFGKKELKIRRECMILLSNGSEKMAEKITVNDDICDKWLKSNGI